MSEIQNQICQKPHSDIRLARLCWNIRYKAPSKNLVSKKRTGVRSQTAFFFKLAH